MSEPQQFGYGDADDVDGFTQGALGAVAAQAVLGHKLGRAALPIGFIAGMLPDADFAIRSASDPLLTVVAHRGFSHSLAFIPIGAALAAAPFLLRRSLRERWRLVVLAALIGFATHGPLDACTSYGTVLLWPLSDVRFAWDWISVVDVFFTAGLIAGGVLAYRRDSRWPAVAAAGFCAIYLGLGAMQEARALGAQQRLAAARGHTIARGRVLPVPGALLLWRSVYRTPDGVIHADAIRVSPFGGPTVREGSALRAYDPALIEWGATARRPDRLRRDLRRYKWFTDGFWAEVPGRPGVVGDMRISSEPAAFAPLWGIRIDPFSAIPVTRERFERDFDVRGLLRETFLGDDRYRDVAAAPL